MMTGNLPGQVVYTENSDAQFNAGTNSSTYVSSAAVLLSYYGRSSGLAAPGASEWFAADWKYRLALSVNSANASSLASYPVQVTVNTQALIAAGRMNADGSDLRFTTAAASGIPLALPYYIESGLNTTSTKIWVRHSNVVPGTNNIYLYYGNPAAPAASSMPSVFLLGDNFTGSDGAAPSSATWVSIQSAAPGSGSTRDIQTNRLRLYFGSPLNNRYFGVRSSGQYSFSSGRRYHAELNARTSGSDSWSSFTLCPTVYNYSYDEGDWLRLAVHHTASGAAYSLERSDYGVKTVLASGSLAAGMHGADILVTASSMTVLLDGAQIYSAANTLAFNSPYIYLEGATASSSLDSFIFDNVSAQPYSAPEPVFGSAGEEQGRRYPSGYFLSQVRDSGSSSRYTSAAWLSTLPQGSTVTLQLRAHDTDVALGTFTSVASGGDPGITGRYVQYKLGFETADPRYTASVGSVTVTYGSAPLLPSGAAGAAQSDSSILWAWADTSSGQYQEDGFRIFDATGTVKGSVGANATQWTETGLYPNTLYSRAVAGYNAAGTGAAASVSRYTLAAQPNVNSDKSTGTWLSGPVTFINLAGFGANGVAYYKCEWNQQTSAQGNWNLTWSSGTLSQSVASTGNYYLHIKSYNGDNVPLTDYQTYGPYWYDKNLPSITGFSPSSAPWQNTEIYPTVSFADTGGSKLYRARHRWSTSPDRPASGWQAYNYTISGDSGTILYTQAGAGQWYLHIEADDVAGNTAWSYSGFGLPAGSAYKLDFTKPSGAVTINGGDTYTASPNVTLSLTYSDTESGVKNLAYKNLGGAFSNTELPQATTSWTLSAGEGNKTAYVQITDNAGNTQQYADTINLDSRTTILGAAVNGTSGGLMGEAAETFAPEATLAWTPTGAALSGKTVAFHFNGSTKTAVTDVLGKASSSFDVPAASGSYIYNVSFSTDGTYSASAATGSVTAAQRATTVITEDVNATSSNPFIAKATLKDFKTSALISGATVVFTFEGSSQTAVTNAIGVATVTFTAPVPVGFYDYTAAYPGNRAYAPTASVSRVGVGLRVTSLAVPPVSSPANAEFAAQATLMDGTSPVSGATVSFYFQTTTYTAITNLSGIAVSTYSAPSSSGTYAYFASFAGDGTYAASAGNAALTVTRRPLSLAGEMGQGYVNATFQARAVLYDGITAGKVAGKNIVFVFETSSATVATDANGAATTIFSAGSLPRASTCYYYFAGDAGYGFADSTAPVSIDRRPVSLAASDISAMLNSSFTASAQLKDTAFAPAGLQGKTLTFSFSGATQTAVTDSLGVASVTYQAGMSTGTYDFYVSFEQDGSYVAANDTGTVTMDKRPAVLSAYPRFVFAFDTIQAVADLKDGVTGSYISSQPVSFVYAGIGQSTTTGSSGGNLGRAYAVYTGTGVAGSYSYSATFPGTSLYSSASSTASITVTPRSVNLAAFPVTAIWATTFTATAEFRDGSNNALVSGKPVRLAFSTASASGIMTAAGVATSTFTAPSSTGTFSWFANFAGDQAYAAAAATGTVTVTRRTPTITPIATTKYVWDSIILNATFLDDGAPVSGRVLTFVFNGDTKTATTNAAGLATTVAFSSVSVPGSYSFSVSFPGDTNYSAQSASSTVTAAARLSSINVGPQSAIANSTITLSATLIDTNWTTGIAGKTVSFTLQGATFAVTTAVTNASGIATAGFYTSSVVGPYTYSATFAGNTNYSGTSSSETLTVTLRPTALEMADYYPPAGSTFTVSAVLKDFATGATIASKNVSFLFRSVTRTGLTNGLGSATTNYFALASTQSYPISASFSADSLYASASISKTVYPGKRNTSLQTSDLNTAVALDTFTVTARLSDYDLGTFLSGSTITFTFNASTYTLTGTAYTNSTGIASVAFRAPASTGSYTYTASYPGDALYNNTLNTSSILVNRRTPTLNPADITGVAATSTFTATALLSDAGLGVTLSTKTLTFVFSSTTNAITNGIGVATTSLVAPVSTGTFVYKVTYGGDALYTPATSYATIGVILKPTVLEVLDVPDAVVGLKFTGTAKLRDIELGNALVTSTKTITFTFRPYAVTYTSNSVTSGGVSTTSYVAPASTGTYGYTAVFAGDGVYGASTSSGTVTVNRRPVLFSLVTNPNQPYAFRANSVSSSFTITATLSDGQVAGLNLENQSISFVFLGSTKTAITNSIGVASVTFASPSSSGTYNYYGYFYGDNSYNPNKEEDSIKTVTIIPRPTTILPQYTSDGRLTWEYAMWGYKPQAQITDSLSGEGVAALTLNFVILNSTITGTSNGVGVTVSSSNFPLVDFTGTYPAVVKFYGNQTYAASTLNGGTDWGQPQQGKIWIERSPAWIDLPQVTLTYPDADTQLDGTINDWWGSSTYPERAYAESKLVGTQVYYSISSIPCGTDCAAVGRNWGPISTGTASAVRLASATVRSPAAAGDYPVSYAFSTTPRFVQWGRGEAQRVIRVGRRLTVIFPDAEPFTVGAQKPIDITVKLADITQSLAGVQNKNLEVVLVTTQTLVTGSAGFPGKVKATFPGMSVGTYTYIARFPDGDGAYMPYTSTGTIVVEKNVTLLSADDALNVPAGNSFLGKATLYISTGGTNTPLAGKTINFVFTSTAGPTINLSAVTNAIGVATVTYWSPYVPASYNYTAAFTEDSDNNSSADNSNTVQVVKRRTQTTAVDSAVYINEIFYSTATLVDLDLANSTIPLKTVSFVLHKGPDVNASAVTNALGIATTTFTSPVSSGPFQLSATFPTDALYAVSSDTRTVTVSRRVTYVDAVDITTPTNNAFTLTATLTDVTFNLGVSTPLAGQQVRFVFNGNTLSGTTGADGKASVSFTAPSVAAAYPFSANFDGTQTYAPVSRNGTITVRKRNTFVSGFNVIAPSGAQFTASANLIDEFGQKLENYTLNFVFTGSTATYNGSDLTDANGLAEALFTAPLSTGIFNYTAAFGGDVTYESSSDDINSVTVNIASTTLSVPDGTVVVNKIYYATATLRGATSGVGVANKLVGFAYPGLTLGQAPTDLAGKAYYSFSPQSTGTYRLDAAFDGDTAFYAAAGSATITVTRRTTGIAVTQPINTEVGALFVTTVTLSDYAVSPSTWVVGRTVDVFFNGVHQYPVTNINGKVYATFTAPSPGGQTYPVTAAFTGDALYESTNTAAVVNVAKRISGLTVDAGSVSALEVFNATATLRWNGAPVAGRIINFTYKGSYLASPATDGAGKAYLQFSAGSSSGPWQVDAAFEDTNDAEYAISSGSNTITVLQRPCRVMPDPLTISVFDNFIATATFLDSVTAATPAGKTAKMSFNWFAANSTGTTSASNGAGLVYYSTGAPNTSGTYRVESFFPGDATYAPSLTSTATVTVNKRPSQLAVADVSTIIDKVFTATATLRSNATLLDNRYVLFTFEGKTFNARTGIAGTGIAVATFTVTVSTGANMIEAVFNGDASYMTSNTATATVTAAMRPTFVTPAAASVVANKTFVASATLSDVYGSFVAGRPVSFTFGSTQNPLTSGVGLASATFTAAVATGTYSIPAEFAGDYKYVASSATLSLTVLRRPTSITSGGNVTVNALDVFYATATLRDLDLIPQASTPLRFVFQNSTFTKYTDGAGVSVTTFTAPAASGAYTLYVHYDGDPTYDVSLLTIPVTVNKRPTGIAMNPVSTLAWDIFKTTASVTDLNNGALKVSTRTVSFTFSWGGSTNSVTDGVGLATAAYASTGTAGNYTFTGTFAGDATYASTATTLSLPVIKRSGFVTGIFVSTRVLDTFTASATFYDNISSAPVANRPLKFNLQGGSTLTATTNGFGTASVTFTAPASSGTYALWIWSDGAADNTYFGSAVYTSSVTLVRRNSRITLAAPSNVIINSTFTPTGTMYDSVSNNTVVSRNLDFHFQGATVTAATNGSGIASAGYTASLSSGTYQMQVSFPGDATYNPSISTQAVNALRYPTRLNGPAISVTMNEVLTATVTLTNYLASTVPAKNVTFTFQAQPFVDQTDALGVAYSTYSAAVASGTYSLPVTFAGDAIYADTDTVIPVLVNKRYAQLTPDPVTVKALNVFTATAALADQLNTSVKLSGQTVWFYFLGPSTITSSGVTNAAGVATADFTAPAANGAYQYRAVFEGDATYHPRTAFGAVTVLLRPSILMQDNSSAPIQEIFRTTATLVDGDTLAPVQSRTITFTYGSSSAAVTAANGKADVGFTAPASSGTYQMNSAFAGDATYAASNSTGSLVVVRRPVVLGPPDITAIIDAVFTSTVTIYDGLSGATVNGRTAAFVFAGSPFFSATNGSGVAVSTFQAPSSSGTYYVAVNFAGDSRYLPNGTTAQLTVDRRPSWIQPADVDARAGEVFTATATLKDTLTPSYKPAGRPLVFFFQGSSFTAVTDGNGVAVSTFQAPPSSGSLRIDVSFAGDARYQVSASSATVRVLRRLSAITFEPVTVNAMNVFTSTATLYDKLNPAVYAAGRNITFTFRGADITSPTDSGGIASAAYTAPATSGTYIIEADFAGDPVYDPSYSSGTVVVTQRPAGITVQDASAYPFELLSASSSLRDLATGAPVAGRSLSFSLDGVNASGVTGGDGVAAAPYTPPAAFGNYMLATAFAGDATYAAGSSTGTISVMQRPTALTPSDESTVALEIFTASATIYDVRLASAVAGKQVNFLFEGATSTAAADENGLAVTQFTAPVSSGVYFFTASFAGDSVYAVSSATGAVAVATRETRVVSRDKNANVGEPFTLSSQLLDPAREDLPGYYVPNVQLKFIFKDRNNVKIDEGYATTNELGIATITFSGPGVPDVYYYSASFEGNYTYTASSATAMIKVGLLTSLVAFDVETEALENFRVKAKLTDYLSTTLDDKPVRFRFIAATNSGLTNADGDSGVAASTFSAPSSSGTYSYYAYFDGDSIYSPSNSTATITVRLRTASFVTYPASALAYSSFTAMVALKDLKTDGKVGGRDVEIYFNGSTVTAVTSLADGTASGVFFAPVSSGTFNFHAAFAGDDTYAPTYSTGTLTVQYRPTNMLSYSVSNLLANSTFTARVQIKDNVNLPVPGLGVDFSFDGNIGIGITDAQGYAETVFTAPASSGTYEFYANFYGDDRYAASNGTGTVTVGPRPTIVFTPPVSSVLGAPLHLSARLVDLTVQNGIEGKTLNFYFDGSTLTALTDSMGVSSVTFTAPAATGTYYFEAAFIGDGVSYTGSFSTAPVTIALNLTRISAQTGLSIKIFEPLNVEARLQDSLGLNLPGLPVKFTFAGEETVSVTSQVGLATASFSTSLLTSTGAYNYEAVYEGDTLYVASSDTSNVVNIGRRESLLIARDAQSTPNKPVAIEALFYDNVNGSALVGAPIAGKDIFFELNLGTYTQTAWSVTSAAGVSTAAFHAPLSTGSFTLTARFADGDPVYLPGLSSATLRVYMDDGTGAIRTKIKVESAAAYITKVFTASGTLTASDDPVPGKSVLFEFYNGLSTFTAAGFTDALGLAVSTFTAPASSGTYQITASFGGDPDFAAAAGTGTLTTSRYPDSLTAKDVSAFAGEAFLAKAVLRDELTGAFLAGKSVTIEFFNGTATETVTAVTSSTGSAEAAFVAPSVPGDYFYTARFAGDAEYVPASDVGSMLIASRGSSTFLVTYEVIVGTGEVFAASATLTSKGYPVPGKAVKLSFGGATLFSTTTAAGLAFSTFTAPAASGTFVCQAEFAGDPSYNAALSSSAIRVVLREVVKPPAVTEVAVTSTAVTMSWAPVTVSSFSQVAGYIVEQAASLRGAVTVSSTVAASTGSAVGYTISLDENNYTYIKVTTKLQNGLESATSKIIEVPPAALAAVEKPNYYYMSKETAANDWAAWVKIPGEVMEKVSASAPLDIEVTKENRPEFLAAYNVQPSGASETIAEGIKSADRRGVKFTVAYPNGTRTSAAGGQVALFWFNGVEWVKLGGEIDVLTGEISTYSRVFGQFAIRSAPLAASFSFTKVAPRIFSPDEASTTVNRARFYFENPAGAEVTIRIFDITGALVRRNLESEGANIMFWNGRDQAGALVKGGAYIYQIEAGDKVTTGTVVVAK